MKSITTSTLAKERNIESKELYKILTSKGFIYKKDDKWNLTNEGKLAGGELKNSPQHGPYFIWPENIDLEKKSNDQTAKLKYCVIYNRYRNSKQKEDFKIEKGTHIAEIFIKEEDGLCSSNKNGHFTFYEYNDTNLINSVNIINPIFALDGTIKI